MSLSGKSKLPDLTELKEVLNMQRLVQCIEFIYFNAQYDTHIVSNLFSNMTGYEYNMGNPRKYPAWKRRFPICLEEIPGAENATIESFRDSFFRTMYRLLLAGAVLARAYVGPVFQARQEGNARFYKVWGDDQWWSEELDNLSLEAQDPVPKDADMAYIRKYPVYNFDVIDSSEIGQWRDREYEACFGPFATWIVEDGRRTWQNTSDDMNEALPDWAEKRSDTGAVQELMLSLVAYEHFNHCFQSNLGRSGSSSSYQSPKQGSRTVSIVRFGVFQVEEVTFPTAIEELKDAPLLAQSHPALEDTAGEDLRCQIDIEQVIFDLDIRTRTPMPFHYEHRGPPGTLEFWRYALKHYLNLTFRRKTFWIPPDCECIWWKEVGRGDIFLNPDWNVVQKYDPATVSWDWRNY